MASNFNPLVTVFQTIAVSGATLKEQIMQIGEGLAFAGSAAAAVAHGKFSEALETIKEFGRQVKKEDAELAAWSARVINGSKAPISALPKTGVADDAVAKTYCVGTGGRWLNGRCQKATAGGADVVTRLPNLKIQFDAEGALMKSALADQMQIIDTAYGAELLSTKQYWEAKRGITEQQFAQERTALQKEIDAQTNIISTLSAIKPKDANQKQELKQRIEDANSKLLKLRTDLKALDGQEITAKFVLTTETEKAQRDLADAIASMKAQLAETAGTETDAQIRQQLEIKYRDTFAHIGDDAEKAKIVNRLIDSQAAQGDLANLQKQWQVALQNMSSEEGAITTEGSSRA